MNTKDAQCQSCKNTSCLIRKHTSNPSLEVDFQKKNVIVCKKGQTFIIEGAPVHGLFFVYQGKVKVAKTGYNGSEQIVRFVTDGEVIGHRGFGNGEFYQIYAVALEDTILCNFSNQSMTDMLKSAPEVTYDFMLFYADELNTSETKVKKFNQMTVKEKVIDTFLYVYRKFGQKDGYIDIPLSRKEIAGFAGTTEEQVIRIISSLKKEGLIVAKGKKLGIADVDLLKKEIAEHNFFLDS